MAASQPYAYDLLETDSIRLFGLANDVSGVTTGTLKSTRLRDAPAYVALSYSWGAERHIVPIEIDGRVLYITHSLAIAIRRLEQLTTENSKWVWIDKICINQDDVLERSHQVRLMGRIFSAAIRTLIWLGPDADKCRPAWTLIDQIYAVFRKHNPHAKFIADIPFQIYSAQNHAALGLPDWDDILWKYLRLLLELPWFTRTWVIQEVAFSPGDPFFIQGGQGNGYPWHRLGWAASWLRRNGYLRLIQIPNELQSVDTMSCIRQSLTPWPLDALLIATSIKFHATDQRDKVYALLGLAAECRSPAGIPDVLHPDYSLDVSELYTKVALFLLRRNHTLTVLTRAGGVSGGVSRAQRKYEFDLLPSWVPNWCDFAVAGRQIVRSLSWLTDSDTTGASVLGFPEVYNAAFGLPTKPSTSPCISEVRLNGLKVDKVTGVFPFHNFLEPLKRQVHDYSIVEVWKAILPRLEKRRAMDIIDSYIRTTTAEQHGLSGNTRDQILKDGAAYLLGHLSSSHLCQEEYSNDLIVLLKRLSIGGNPNRYISLATNFCIQRTFIITSNGRMGIGPADTLPGDMITILFGGGVPYILRVDSEQTSSLVGESYIDGLMKGEAIQYWKQNNFVEETFNLR
ncbi:HET domain-containing protein [Nemania abortiva]|nr:HET domain-containing protein [Nemania abortiva]